jgi:hypothetical protein
MLSGTIGMPYLIGMALALVVASFAAIVGLDRERGFYPTLMIVIAAYYDLFAVISGSGMTLRSELLASTAFAVAAIVGFRFNLWFVVLALASHGVFDFVHGRLIFDSGVPSWWPAFCGTYDVTAAICLSLRLVTGSRNLTLTIESANVCGGRE